MSELDEIRRKRLETYGNVPTDLGENIVAYLEYTVRYNHGASVLVLAAKQNVLKVMAAIIIYVATKEGWGETDVTSYSAFEVAKQRLYLGNNILIKLQQKEMSHPDWSFTSLDCSEGYSNIFYDHELNADDPYFDTIKRGYYNNVSN